MNLLPLLLAFTANQYSQDVDKDFVLVGDKAYGFMLPVKVCGEAFVNEARWSHDGSFVLMKRLTPKVTADQAIKLIAASAAGERVVPPPQERSLSVWNKKTERRIELFKSESDSVHIGQAEWIPRSSNLLALISESTPARPSETGSVRTTLIECDARSGARRTLAASSEPGIFPRVMVSPTQSLGIVIWSPLEFGAPTASTQPQRLQVYRPGAALSAPITLPQDSQVYGWTSDGRSVTAIVVERQAEGRAIRKVYVVNLGTGQVVATDDTLLSNRPLGGPNQVVEDLRLNPPFSRNEASVRPVGLTGAEEKGNGRGALVTLEAEYAEISPAKDGVLYVTRGVAIFRPLVPVPKDLYDKAKAAAERAEAISRAKQVALGMIMYAADNDDNLPGNGSDWQRSIAPYLKNDSMFNGFNYTFGGGSMNQIERPAETELGHIPIEGGRVVAYCDGHVKFIPDN